MRHEYHDLDGCGEKQCRVYDMPARGDYWQSVTDVPCPIDGCDGLVQWHEAGYVPGYRICAKCLRHFLARGTAQSPTLIRVGNRRGW